MLLVHFISCHPITSTVHKLFFFNPVPSTNTKLNNTNPTAPGIPNIPEGGTTGAKEVSKVDDNNRRETTQKPPDNSLMVGEINGALSGLGELKIELLKLHTVVSEQFL